MRTIIILLAFLPLFTFSQVAQQEINWLSLEKAKEFAAKNNGQILIFFWSFWIT